MCALLLVALWPMLVAPAAIAQQQVPAADLLTIGQVVAIWPKLSPQQQFIAIEQLLRAGQFETAGRLLDAASYANPLDRANKRFYQAMVERGHGRNKDAVVIFREVLAQHPEFTRARLELAHTLFVINEDDSARHNFELVLGGASAMPGLQETVRSYINAIDGRKRWDFTTFLTIAPSTNLNQGANAQAITVNGLPFQLAGRNVKTSGVGVYTGFQAGYRHPMTDAIDLVVSGGAQAKRYKDGDFNDTLVNASIGPKWRFERGFLGLYGVADHRWIADGDYATTYGGIISGGFSLTAADLLFADAGCSERRFDHDWKSADLTYQNGHVCFASGRYDHYFDSRTYMRVLGTVGEERTGRAHLDNRSRGIGLGGYREIPWGISIYLQGLYTDSRYDGVYPSFADVRHDRRTDISLNLTKRDLVIFGLAPQLQYTFTHNDSNIPLHTYDAHGLALTLTKRF
jgi:outer membrane protein